jgi:hypothetical protein
MGVVGLCRNLSGEASCLVQFEQERYAQINGDRAEGEASERVSGRAKTNGLNDAAAKRLNYLLFGRDRLNLKLT